LRVSPEFAAGGVCAYCAFGPSLHQEPRERSKFTIRYLGHPLLWPGTGLDSKLPLGFGLTKHQLFGELPFHGLLLRACLGRLSESLVSHRFWLVQTDLKIFPSSASGRKWGGSGEVHNTILIRNFSLYLWTIKPGLGICRNSIASNKNMCGFPVGRSTSHGRR
jgi:hypothetical protein